MKKTLQGQIKLYGVARVFLATCQRFADRLAQKGIKGKENYKRSIAGAFQYFVSEQIEIPQNLINELLETA